MKVYTEIKVGDNIIYRTHDNVCKVFGIKKYPKEKATIEMENGYKLWFPIICDDKNGWNNYLNCNEDEIHQKENNNKKVATNKTSISSDKFIVFGKYVDGYKFLGVFVTVQAKKKITVYKKISNSILLDNCME